jgi:O-succinylhomoserine sulfhydrylase
MNKDKKQFETNAIRTQAEQSLHREHSVPLYVTSSYTFDDAEQMRAIFADEIEGNIYSRFTNPNAQELVDKMCLLEGAEAGYATASGMSAIFASFMALLKTGDHILASSSIFGSTHTMLSKILPKYGILMQMSIIQNYGKG